MNLATSALDLFSCRINAVHIYFPACLNSVELIDILSPGIFPLTETSLAAMKICDLVLSFISSVPPTATKYQSMPIISGPGLHEIVVFLPAKITELLGPLSTDAIASVQIEYSYINPREKSFANTF